MLALMRGFEKLSARESEILVLRFWKRMKLHEIGSVYNLSKDRIRQIEANALCRLGKYLRRADIFLHP